ncbi:hypothetical protein B0J18DRAFT_301274 [Chaetomium sp. MPI-SDFR-AT-0129]|nr:hypothetical protein B0J18DRAFT_301274 [Chaetomium sp. MPI-SDFR-AT-0129]
METTTLTPISQPLSSYDENLEQCMIDGGIYPEFYSHHGRLVPKPRNFDQDVEILPIRRPSLSSETLTASMFETFRLRHRDSDARYPDERNLHMVEIIPIIVGNAEDKKATGTRFFNLDAMPAGHPIKVAPDFFDGAARDAVEKAVRVNLNHMIIPSKYSTRVPMAPNFFLDVTPKEAKFRAAMRKTMLHGALGARAMLALQNYGVEEPIFDGKAYTYTAAYHPEVVTLQIFAHHVTPPTTPEGKPEYHMTELGGWKMTRKIEDFVRGVTAFRNVRELAQRHRDEFIRAANERARRLSEDQQLREKGDPSEMRERSEKQEPVEDQQPIAETTGVVVEGE